VECLDFFGERAVLWQNGAFLNLNRLLPPQDPVVRWLYLKDANDMNDRGTIVGRGRFQFSNQDCNGVKWRAFVLTTPAIILLEQPALSANNIFSFTIVGPAGIQCTVEATTDPTTGSWSSIGTVTLTGGTAVFTDSNSPSYSARFYRVKSGSLTSGDVLGYLIRVLATGYSMFGNPFEMKDNRIPAVFTGVVDGTTVSKWDEVTQTWRSTIKFTDTGGLPDWTDRMLTAYPGEGTVVQTASAFTNKVFGRVRQNSVNKRVAAQLAVHSSLIAVAGSVDGTLRFPIAHGDRIDRMTSPNGSYTSYTYSNGTWSPSAPSIALGEAFWSSKAKAVIWRQNQSVW